MTRQYFLALIKEAAQDPRRSATRILSLPLRPVELIQALILVSSLAVIGVYAVAYISLVRTGEGMALPMPFGLFGLQISAMLVLAGAMALIGRVFGGTGTFEGALRVMVWLQGLMVVLQVIQLLLLIVLPFLAGLASIGAFFLVGWMAVGMVAGLHGFRSLGLTFLGMMGGLVLVSFALVAVLGSILPSAL